jgi:uncharacterized protein (UPF0548 family)
MSTDPEPLTYPEVGATAGGALPTGYRHVRRTERLGAGPDVFHAVAAGMAAWRIQRDAGLTVRTEAARPAPDARFVTGIRLGPLRLAAPCRIVWYVEEPDRYGFGFGTLAGHPECGEESFLVEWTGTDDVVFSIAAFSRPAAWYARLGAAPARWLQDRVTDRYVAAARGLAAG